MNSCFQNIKLVIERERIDYSSGFFPQLKCRQIDCFPVLCCILEDCWYRAILPRVEFRTDTIIKLLSITKLLFSSRKNKCILYLFVSTQSFTSLIFCVVLDNSKLETFKVPNIDKMMISAILVSQFKNFIAENMIVNVQYIKRMML